MPRLTARSSMPPARRRRTQRERSEATQQVLLDAARELFATRGFTETSLDDVVSRAGVTKGALYHHYEGKAELFREVFLREQARLGLISIRAYSTEQDPLDAFYAGCAAFLRASLDEGFQRIALIDAPVVLGWATVRAIETEGSLAMIEDALERAMDAGAIEVRPVRPLATLLFGAMCEGSMLIACAEEPRAALAGTLTELRRIIASLE